jgi:hypothetical protein
MENAGFMMEQLSLYITTLKLGGCILGMPKVNKNFLPPDGMDYIIMMSLGYADGEAIRETRNFKRKGLGEICSAPDRPDLFEPSRLAPSALNLQPTFYRLLDGNKIDIYVDASRGLLKLLAKKYRKFDMGVSLAHLFINFKEKNLTPKIKDVRADGADGITAGGTAVSKDAIGANASNVGAVELKNHDYVLSVEFC